MSFFQRSRTAEPADRWRFLFIKEIDLHCSSPVPDLKQGQSPSLCWRTLVTERIDRDPNGSIEANLFEHESSTETSRRYREYLEGEQGTPDPQGVQSHLFRSNIPLSRENPGVAKIDLSTADVRFTCSIFASTDSSCRECLSILPARFTSASRP